MNKGDRKDIIALDRPETSLSHRDIIMSKTFLRRIYEDWYALFNAYVNELPKGKILELGSGGGFMQDCIPDIISSDIMDIPGVDMRVDAMDLPFESNELSGIFMIDVLHHMNDCEQFFSEGQRVLKRGGKIIMIEPANTMMSRFIYQKFHHEEFDPKASWKLDQGSGPLSGANGAIPWIVFERDYDKFKGNYPELKLKSKQLLTPFLYILSGGLSKRSLAPGFSYGFFKFIEKMSRPILSYTAMFQMIVVERVESK